MVYADIDPVAVAPGKALHTRGNDAAPSRAICAARFANLVGVARKPGP